MSYKEAQKKYARIGIDTEKAINDLGKISISLHCWQGPAASPRPATTPARPAHLAS